MPRTGTPLTADITCASNTHLIFPSRVPTRQTPSAIAILPSSINSNPQRKNQRTFSLPPSPSEWRYLSEAKAYDSIPAAAVTDFGPIY